MRLAIGGIMHESNTFSPRLTDLAAFQVQREGEVIKRWQETHHEMGGFIAGATRFGYELWPILMAGATPSGLVTAEAFETLAGELLDRLANAPPLGGLLLALHGAMVTEAYPDGDGELVRRLRAVLGREFPLVVTHDFHANISAQVVREATALIAYQTNPHLDQRERGWQAAELLARISSGEVKPVQALRKPAMVLNILHQNTGVEPLKSIMQAARAVAQQPGVLAASVTAGYPYADVDEMGPAAVVVTDGNSELAGQAADHLAGRLWTIREQLTIDLPEAAEAVRQARQSTPTPVILVDMGDNIGGGSAGDSTFILVELLRQQAEGWLVVLADPEAVQACERAGIGATLTLRVGGKQDNLHGEPVAVSGRVKCLHDGQYEETEPRHGGQRYYDQGLTAVLETQPERPSEQASTVSSLLVLTSHRQVPFSLQQLLSLGIQPSRQKIIVVKAAIAYRAAYEPIAGRIVEVDTPGLTAVNPARFIYRHVRRPLWGLGREP